jgi:predicted ATPase/class 3 adenylate cyclase/DNA-binding CsgD family transcriptional regulator
MSQAELCAESPPVNWSDLGMSEPLPTGTVTLLMADTEGSTRLWESQPDEMTAAFANLDRMLTEVVVAHHGVRPLEQGEGDSFVVAFGRASDAIACALALQLAPLGLIRLRVGLHTGEAQLRDETNYIGTTINRAARLRDLAHGGQTVLSSTTGDLVADRLPAGVWLTDLGSHAVRDLPRPQRVLQLCHPDLQTEFPALRTSSAVRAHNVPAQLTSFVGRHVELASVCRTVTENRLVTLTGAGGVGKTRFAVELAARLVSDFADGVWWIDLAPVTDADSVQGAMARALSLPDQTGRSDSDTLLRFVSDRHILLILDNCEHLLNACGTATTTLLGGSPHLHLLATSREPIGITGEVTCRVPSLGLDDEAVELFIDRAQRARPDLRLSDRDAELVFDICRRLDGIPLAIELAAARIRALSLPQIVDSLHDRFRLLTGSARTAVRRQQTLRASVDWSHALLTEPERVLFRRLAVFLGGFDLTDAENVGADTELEQYQVLDQLTLLVDKSLVIAENHSGSMRYRLLETMRQYALEKLGESGEAGAVRDRHCENYTEAAIALASHPEHQRFVGWATTEIDNLRSAFEWSRETSDSQTALQLTSALQRFWVTRARMREGLVWFDTVLTDAPEADVAPAVWAKAVSDHSVLAAWLTMPTSVPRAQHALDLARQLGEEPLIVDSLLACGVLTVYDQSIARTYFAEARELARAADDRRRLCEVSVYLAIAAAFWGEPVIARAAAEEGSKLADALGDGFMSWNSRTWRGAALTLQGNLSEAGSVLSALAQNGIEMGDLFMTVLGHTGLGRVRASQGDASAARASAQVALDAATAMGGFLEDTDYAVLADAALAEGNSAAAKEACETSWRSTVPQRAVLTRSLNPMPQALFACGELAAARRWADDSVATVPGWHKLVALMVRAHIALAQNEPEQAARDSYDALELAARTGGWWRLPDVLEGLARVVMGEGRNPRAARLFGAADAIRQRSGEVRFKLYDADYDEAIRCVRSALGPQEFAVAWDDGAALSTEESIAFAIRGRGERRRPTRGWGSLTPTERDVARLVTDGLATKDIAARLFISSRTVQTHLTHIYRKLGLTSRLQLAQEAAQHL